MAANSGTNATVPSANAIFLTSRLCSSIGNGACGAHGQACCGSARCEADAGLACDKSNVCSLETPATQGQRCITAGDCAIDVCVAIGDHQACSKYCSNDPGCAIAGWTCDAGTKQCTCSPSSELCNGKDDDCDGIIDDNAANADCDSQIAGSLCNGAQCQCSAPLTHCGNACVDLTSDAANCGGCGQGCSANEICTGSQCDKPSCKGPLQCQGESCCTTLPVPGGTFPMGRSLNGTDADIEVPASAEAVAIAVPLPPQGEYVIALPYKLPKPEPGAEYFLNIEFKLNRAMWKPQ